MADVPRDSRQLHDQIIDHDLNNLPVERLLALLIIEIRRLRADNWRDRKDEDGGAGTGTAASG